jgi:hypothetical protein
MYVTTPYLSVQHILDYHPLHGYRFAVFCVGNTPKPKKHLDINCALCDLRNEAEESFEHREWKQMMNKIM